MQEELQDPTLTKYKGSVCIYRPRGPVDAWTTYRQQERSHVNPKGARRCQPSVRSLHDLYRESLNAKLFLVNDPITWTTLLDPHVSVHWIHQAINIRHQPITLSRCDWTGLPCPDGMVAAYAVIEHLGT